VCWCAAELTARSARGAKRDGHGQKSTKGKEGSGAAAGGGGVSTRGC
jgi:hypothetical protein